MFVKANVSRDRFGGVTLEYKFNGVDVELYFNQGGEVSDLESHLTPSQIRKLESAWTDEQVRINLPVDIAEVYLPVEYYTA